MKSEKEHIPLLSSKEDTVTYQINESEHSNVEKEEKGSVLKDLKDKQKEAAKAPAKETVEKAAKAKGGEAL